MSIHSFLAAMQFRSLLTCLLFLLLIVKCQSGSSVNQGTIHPTAENIPEATDPSLVIDLSDLEAWEDGPLFADTVGYATTMFGRDDGEDYELLAWVQDIAFDGKGTIFVLDADPRSNASSNVKVVHMVDVTGQYLGSLGQPGEGPGEFMHVDHLILADDGHLLMVAGRERHIDTFRRGNSGEFEFERRIVTQTVAEDGCAIGDHFYLLAYDAESGHVIHKYALDGEYIFGFGERYESTNPFVVEILSGRGQLVCNQTRGIIGYLPQFVPVLMAYGEDGELDWNLRVEGIKPSTEVLETVSDDGAPSIRYSGALQSEAGRGSLRAAIVRGDGNFYLVVFVATGEDNRRSLVFRVDAQTGAWDHVGRGSIPSVLEEGLMVHMPSPGADQLQVRIRTRTM